MQGLVVIGAKLDTIDAHRGAPPSSTSDRIRRMTMTIITGVRRAATP
jgi:hypothetical protein